jgi:hypothetical protein
MQTRVASDDQESLFSLKSDYTRFAFDDEFLLSKTYQNSPLRDYVNPKREHEHSPSPALAEDVLVRAGNVRESNLSVSNLSVSNLSSTVGKISIRDSETITRDFPQRGSEPRAYSLNRNLDEPRTLGV